MNEIAELQRRFDQLRERVSVLERELQDVPALVRECLEETRLMTHEARRLLDELADND